MIKMFIILLLLIVSSLIVAILWMSQGPLKSGSKNLEVIKLADTQATKSETLKILSWNLAYGHGKGSEGEGYYQKSKDDYDKKIQSMGDVLKKANADIVLLQEIDFDSKRSHHVNQAKILAEIGGYSYVAEAPSWILNYVPFPYWPIQNQFARTNSGGAILSKYPLTKHDLLLFTKPKENPWWYNLFYLFRYAQRVTVKINDKEFSAVNVHLEAFDGPSREEQINEISSWVKGDPISLIAGDFNSLEAHHPKIESKEEYGDHTLELLRAKLKLKESIDLKSLDFKKDFTFPADNPDRRLDHLFFESSQFDFVSQQVYPAGNLSDHLPILIELRFR